MPFFSYVIFSLVLFTFLKFITSNNVAVTLLEDNHLVSSVVWNENVRKAVFVMVDCLDLPNCGAS